MNRLLPLMACVALPGCVFSSAVVPPMTFALAAPMPEDDGPTEADRLAMLRDHSRHRLHDPAVGPKCSVKVTLTGRRTWRLSSCEGELKCWALGGGGYDCERPIAAVTPQL